VLFLQHPVLVLVFKQKLCCSLTSRLGSVVFCFLLSFRGSWWSAPPSVGCGSLSLSSGSRISSVVHQLSCFGVGFSLCWLTGGLCLCLAPFLWGKVSDLSASPLLSAFMMVCWLFFSFAVLFDFGYCSLDQEMSFVDRYLPCFRQQIITIFVYWKFAWSDLHAPCSFLWCTFSNSAPLLCVNFQFFV
jgi:hypothetical protein